MGVMTSYFTIWTAEMAMINLTIISSSCVESQTFWAKTDATWDVLHFCGISAIDIFSLEALFWKKSPKGSNLSQSQKNLSCKKLLSDFFDFFQSSKVKLTFLEFNK